MIVFNSILARTHTSLSGRPYISPYSGDGSTDTDSSIVAGVTVGYALHTSVKRVREIIGNVRTPHDGVDVCAHESPLVPFTVQLCALVTLQNSRDRSPVRTSAGRASK